MATQTNYTGYSSGRRYVWFNHASDQRSVSSPISRWVTHLLVHPPTHPLIHAVKHPLNICHDILSIHNLSTLSTPLLSTHALSISLLSLLLSCLFVCWGSSRHRGVRHRGRLFWLGELPRRDRRIPRPTQHHLTESTRATSCRRRSEGWDDPD